MIKKAFATIAVMLMSAVAVAQVATGPQPFGTFGGGPFDSVDLGSLNVNFGVPITQKAGRGASFYYILSYNNSIWFPTTVNGVLTWQPTSTNYGWQSQTNAGAFGYLSHSSAHGRCSPSGFYTSFTNYVYHDPLGATHPLVGASFSIDCGGGSSATDGTTQDGTGLTLHLDTVPNGKLTRRDGSIVNLPNVSTPSYVDTNGNQITTDGSNYYDTLGATALTVSGVAPNPTTYTIPNSSGGNSVVTVNYTSFTIQTNFQCSGVQEYAATAANLITSITLPDGTKYLFTYEQTPTLDATHTTGRIASVTLPSTGIILYAYTGGSQGITCSDGSTAGLTRTLQSAPPATEGIWTYSRSANGANWNTTITDPANNQSVLQFAPFSNAFYEVQRQVYQGSVSQNPLLTVTHCYNGACNNSISAPVSTLDLYTTPAGAPSAQHSEIGYNTFGLPTVRDDWDYGGALLRVTTTNYASPGNGIVNRPSDVTVADGLGNWVSRTVFAYDESALAATNSAPNHDYTNYGSAFTQRGNLTTVKNWVSGTTYISSTRTYDDLGNLRSATDAGGHQTSFDYADSYNDGINHNSQAFATTITLPQTANAGGGSPFSHLVKSKFYWPSAMLYQGTDQNNQVTSYTYDNMWRPSTISYPDGGQTSLIYSISGGLPLTEIQKKIDATNSTDEFQLADGFGRPSRFGKFNGGEAGGAYDQSDTCYNSSGQISFVTYDYQSPGNTPKVCSGAGDSFTYDALGRGTSVTHSDGTSVNTSYYARAVQVQDEGNGSGTRVTHIYQQDGLGRTKTTCEVAATIFSTGTTVACGLDMTGNPTGVTTTYTYDPMGNVTQISQGALMNRTMTYDGLGHQLTEIIPEAGGTQNTQTSYGYNSAGLLATRTRPSANQPATCIAAGNCATTTTNYAYDELNRLRTISYTGSENTDSVARFYDDPNASLGTFYNDGQLIAAATEDHNFTTVHTWVNFGFEKMGREALETQKPNGTQYTLNYTYNLIGLPATSANSQGVTFTYSYNRGARLTQMTSSLSDANHPGTLFSAAHYNAYGELVSDSLGNGVNETFNYDVRARMLSSNATKSTTTIYSLGGPGTGNVMTYAPNSGLSGANDSVNGSWGYSYDALNRIAGANKSGGTNFTFDIDRNANRWNENPGAQKGFDTSTNRILSSSGVTYDAAGNIIDDGVCTYTYDAEYRLTSAGRCVTAASFSYDAFGRRVHRVKGATVFDYIYDQDGNIAAQLSSGSLVRSEIHVLGKHLASYYGGSTYFSHNDWLGSARVRTDVNGNGVSTCTNDPYGDNTNCTGSVIPSTIDYAGMLYDNDTGLYQTLFRYYNPRLGLWMTPDPAGLAAADGGDPQSLNRYAYVKHSPVNFFDPWGLVWESFDWRFCVDSGSGEHCETGTSWVWFDDGNGGGNDLGGSGGGTEGTDQTKLGQNICRSDNATPRGNGTLGSRLCDYTCNNRYATNSTFTINHIRNAKKDPRCQVIGSCPTVVITDVFYLSSDYLGNVNAIYQEVRNCSAPAAGPKPK